MNSTNQSCTFRIELRVIFISISFLFIVYSTSAQSYGGIDKIAIIKMFNGQQPSATAYLTINEPCGNNRPPNCGKQSQEMVSLNPNRQYNSGTTFTTHDNYTILVRSNGVTSQIQPNSSNMIKSTNGNEVHNPKGVVGIIADKSRDLSKSIIINGHNVSAKMKTTQFWVDSRGAQTKFSPVEGTITILEEVSVNIGNKKFEDKTENRERARDATFPVRTERSGGEPDYTTGQQQSKNYNTVYDAISTINTYIQQYGSNMYPLELADTYILLGEFYLNTGQYNNAISCFDYSAEIYTDVDPTGLDALEAELYLAEAQIYSNDPDGYDAVTETIDELLGDLQYYYEEYIYAGQIEEYDIQTDYCYQVVDTMDLLGWAYDLLDNEDEADKYYEAAEAYPCQD